MHINNMTANTRLAAMADVIATLNQSCDNLEWLQELVSDGCALLASIKDDMEPATDKQHTTWLKLLRDFNKAVRNATDTTCIAEQDNIELR